jgi:hypothetical protein
MSLSKEIDKLVCSWTNFLICWITDGIDQKTLLISSFAPVQIKAIFDDESEECIYQNESVNSPYGMCPLRLVWPQLWSFKEQANLKTTWSLYD